MTPEQLQAMLDSGDVAGCITLLAGATEAERRRAAPLAAACFKLAFIEVPDVLIAVSTGELSRSPVWQKYLREHYPDALAHQGKRRVAQVATLGTATWGELRKLGFRCFPPIEDALAVLAARRPGWAGQWAELILSFENSRRSPRPLWECWQYVRRMIRAGLCEPPAGPQYVRGMVMGLVLGHPATTLRPALLANPDLLEGPVWAIFEVDGLAANGWEEGLAELAAEGRLDRSRLLDVSLRALERDDKVEVAKWLALMHETLGPTLAERAERADRYLGLLASRNPATVGFALKALGVLDRGKRLEPVPLLDAIRPVLLARAKATLESALRLIDHAATRAPHRASHAAALAADALVHDAPAILKLVVDLIERHGDRADAALVDLIRDRLPGVAASQRGRLAAWLGPEPAPGEAAAAGITPDTDLTADLLARASALDPALAERTGVTTAVIELQGGGDRLPSSAPFGIGDAPRLDPARRLRPIVDLDELVLMFGRFLEKHRDADDLERLLDGVARLANPTLPDFAARAAPLRTRAQAEIHSSRPVVQAVARLALAWISGSWPLGLPIEQDTEPTHLLTARLARLAERVAQRRAAPLLSAATHQGGWIDPREFVVRLAGWLAGAEPIDRVDATLGIIRLAPDHGPRRVALAALAGIDDEVAAACRHALGGAGERVGDDPRLWIAAARARHPDASDPLVGARFPTFRPDGASPARWRVEPWTRTDQPWFEFQHPLVVRHPPVPTSGLGAFPSLWVQTARNWGGWEPWWAVTIWPGGRESLCAVAYPWFLVGRIEPYMAEKYRPILAAIADADVPLGPMARLVAAVTLVAGSPEVRGQAVDLIVAAVEDGRLDAPHLGEALGWVVVREIAVTARLVGVLGEVARVGPLPARVVVRAIEHLLAVLTSEPKQFALLLEFLHEQILETGTNLLTVDAGDFLRDGDLTPRAAGLARRLLDPAAPSNPDGDRSAAVRALTGRLARAERWAAIEAAGASAAVDPPNQPRC